MCNVGPNGVTRVPVRENMWHGMMELYHLRRGRFSHVGRYDFSSGRVDAIGASSQDRNRIGSWEVGWES
jgi:hypothetical protein